MSIACPNCGYENPDSNGTCAICNTQLQTPGAGSGQFSPGVKNSAIRGFELIRYSALLLLITFIAGIAVFVIAISIFLSSLAPTLVPTPTGNVTTTPIITPGIVSFLWDLIIIAIADLAIELISLYLIYGGFKHLELVDSKLRTGKIGAILSLVGVAILVATVLAISVTSISLINQISQGASTPAISDFSFPYMSVLELVGGVITLVGGIMIVIGLYNIGTMFDDTSMKVGAIFYILISFIGAILILVATTNILRRIRGSSGGAAEPPYPSNP